jgi:uncharacterized protein
MHDPKTKREDGQMWVAEIWRYPVKSLAGEQLEYAEVHADGIFGDRRVLVYDEQSGRLITSRTHPRLLGLRGTLDPDGVPLINGHPWDDVEPARAVMAAAGEHARLIRWDGMERFDVLPLLVATDGALEVFGHDRRRLRPNIVIGGAGRARMARTSCPHWRGHCRVCKASSQVCHDDLRPGYDAAEPFCVT